MAKQFQVDTAGTLLTGLVSYWPLDGNSNDFFASGNGTDANMGYVTGKVGSAADFSGTNARVSMANDFAWTKLSLAFWVKFDTLGATDRWLVGKTNSTIAAGSDFEFHVGLNNSGADWAVVVNNANVVSVSLASLGTTTGVWYHVIATIDEDNNTCELFINNVSVASSATATQTHNNLTNGINLGERRDGFFDLDGQMDELALHTKIYSAQERADLFNNGSGQTMIDATTAIRSIVGVQKSKRPRISRWPRVRMGKVERWQDIP